MLQYFRYNPSNNWVYIWVFLGNLLTTTIREVLHALDRFENRKAEGIAGVILFSILWFILLVPPIWITVQYISPDWFQKLTCQIKKQEVTSYLLIVTWVETTLVSMPYYIGDNLYPTVRDYGTHIKCYEVCQRNCLITSLVFSCFATIVLFFSNSALSELLESWEIKDKEQKNQNLSNKAAKMITYIIKIDIVYTTVIGMGTSFGLVDTSKNFCAHGSVVYGSLALVACYIVGLIVEWFTCIVIVRRSANDKVCCSMTIVTIVASILLVVFIMADNHLPSNTTSATSHLTRHNVLMQHKESVE